jgi:hypothetical protein
MAKKQHGLSTYTDAIAQEICDRLSNGEPLRQICRDEHMPAWQTFYDWVRNDADLAKRIARARLEEAVSLWADEDETSLVAQPDRTGRLNRAY